MHKCQNPECDRGNVKDQFPYCYECNEKIKRGELNLPPDGITPTTTPSDVPSSAFFGMVFNKAVDASLHFSSKYSSGTVGEDQFMGLLNDNFDRLMTFALKKKKELMEGLWASPAHDRATKSGISQEKRNHE